MPDLRSCLQAAKARRRILFESTATTAFRAVNGAGDGSLLAPFTLDWLAGVGVLNLYQSLPEAYESELVAAVVEVFQPRAVYLKRRPREARVAATVQREHLAPEGPVFGEPAPEVKVLESGRVFTLRPGSGLGTGLYLDMRDARTFLGARVSGRRVLNTFAYTCAFGVVTTLGGAERVLNLDASRRVLDWGITNYRANGLRPQRQDFVSGDVFDWLGRFARRTETFGIVILDPPSFATVNGRRFSAAVDYARLVSLAAPVVSPGGWLVAACNHAGLSRPAFHSQLREGLKFARRGWNLVQTFGQPSQDFPEPGEAEGRLKVAVLEIE